MWAMNITVKDVQIPFKSFPIDLSLNLNETGSINLNGNVGLAPLAADAELNLKHIEIHPSNPLDRFWCRCAERGVDLAGSMHVSTERADEPLMRFRNLVVMVTSRIGTSTIFDMEALNVSRIAKCRAGGDDRRNCLAGAIRPYRGGLKAAQSRLVVSPQPDQTAVRIQRAVYLHRQCQDRQVSRDVQDLSVEPNMRTSLTGSAGVKVLVDSCKKNVNLRQSWKSSSLK